MQTTTTGPKEATAKGIPGSDRPASYYLNLVAKAFLAHLTSEVEFGLPANHMDLTNQRDEYYTILDYLAENLNNEQQLPAALTVPLEEYNELAERLRKMKKELDRERGLDRLPDLPADGEINEMAERLRRMQRELDRERGKE